MLREALTEHGRHWDEIEVRLKGERIRCGGNGMAAVVRRTLLALMQARARDVGARAALLDRGRPGRARRLRPGRGRGRRGLEAARAVR